jgi:putative ABC transport system permease protein
MLSDLWMRLRALVRRGAMECELDDEMKFHFEQQVGKFIARGMAPEEARRLARLEFGGIDSVEEECREARGVYWLESVIQDAPYGLRVLRKSPGFTIVAVLTLALGIGVNTSIFSVLEAQIWAPLPFPDSRNLVNIGGYDASRPDRTYMLPAAGYAEWLAAARDSFSSVCAFLGSDYHTTPGEDTAEMVTARPVTASFFETLEMPPVIGRAFVPEEEQPGRDHEVILSYAYWQNHLAGSSDISGRTLVLDGAAYMIVGVAPKDLRFEYFGDPDMYVPLALTPKQLARDSGVGLEIVARRKAGAPLTAVQAKMDLIADQLAAQDPEWNAHRVRRGIKAETLADAYIGPHEGLFFFAGAAGLVLLIACANVASLLLARGLARQHEFGIRSALGAGRAALLRQLLIEGALLGILGGALGIVVSLWSSRALNRLLPPDFLFRDVEPRLDVRVLAFAVAISVAAAIVAALAPGLIASRVDLARTMQSGARGMAGGMRHQRLRGALVIAEVAMAVTLLFGAGLFLNSFVREARAPLGFETHKLVSLGLTFADRRYAEPKNLWLANHEILRRVRAVPGISDAAMASQIPFAGGISADFAIAGRPEPPSGERRPGAIFSVVTANYFELLKIPFLAGREFGAEDAADSRAVAIVNENFVRDFFPGGDPLGAEMDIFDEDAGVKKFRVRIVGIVQNTHLFGPNEVPFDFIYTSAEQIPLTAFNNSVFAIAATDLPIGSVLGPIEHQISEVDRSIPVTHAATMDERADEALRGARGDLILIGVFAVLAVALVAVGLFGAIAYFVEQRTREFGIRLALGASPSGILLRALKQSAVLGVTGLVLGVSVSLALGRLLGSALYLVRGKHDGLLYGVSIADPFTLASACLLLAIVLVVASYLPARRAMRVDPMVALRHE